MKNILAFIVLGSWWAAASAAETYRIDPNHTHATFHFKHFGLSTFAGKIPAQEGSITLDRAAKSGTVDVRFDLKRIATGVAKFDDHLRSADFFEVDKHPTATFKASKVTFQGDKPATVTGDLTIKNITRPVTLEVTSFTCIDKHPMANAPACGANATASIKRSDFGLTYALPAVRDEVELEIEVEAVRE